MSNIIHEYRDEKGKLHCKDGPAIEWADGTKKWLYHGEIHRENGPAGNIVLCISGSLIN